MFNDLDRSVLIGQTDSLTMEKKLGSGGFGDVWSGKLQRVRTIFCGPYGLVNNKGYIQYFLDHKSM